MMCVQILVYQTPTFSSSFKKETGQSFVSYLTDYRMDRAEELVLNTDAKSYKIAEKSDIRMPTTSVMYSKRSSVFLLPNTELPGNNKAKSRKSEDIKNGTKYIETRE